jgi:hypothetical protein
MRGMPYQVKKLLADGDSNTKIAKSNAGTATHTYRTWALSLAPANESGHQLCASSSPGCREACLFKQGRGAWPNTQVARVAKAIAYMEHREWFLERLRCEVEAAIRVAKRAGEKAAFRLNVVSDVQWESIVPCLFCDNPDGQFYDYSKHARRAIKFASGGGPKNYHLTFSRSETNQTDCLAVLAAGGNVAVVFRGRPLPDSWRGYQVSDGDQTDLRFLDPTNVVVGLVAKGTGRHDASGFVVDQDSVVQQNPRFALPVAP